MNLGKRISAIVIALILLVCASSVSVFAEVTTKIDFADAASFEKALNNGENLVGKTVRFVVNEYMPNSVLGYNCWAGEHLNFISADNLKVKANDVIEGKVTAVSSMLGSWIINYDVLSINKASEENETNSVDYESMTTEEVLVLGKWVAEDGSDASITFSTVDGENTGFALADGDYKTPFTWEVIRSSSVKLTLSETAGVQVSMMYACVDNVPKLLDFSTMEFFVLDTSKEGEANTADYDSMTLEEVLLLGKWIAVDKYSDTTFEFYADEDSKIGRATSYKGTTFIFDWEVSGTMMVKLTELAFVGDKMTFSMMYSCVDNVPTLLDLSTAKFYVLDTSTVAE